MQGKIVRPSTDTQRRAGKINVTQYNGHLKGGHAPRCTPRCVVAASCSCHLASLTLGFGRSANSIIRKCGVLIGGLHVRCGRGAGHETGREPVLRCEVPLGLRQPLTAALQLFSADRAGRCSSPTGSVHVKASVWREGTRGVLGGDAHHRGKGMMRRTQGQRTTASHDRAPSSADTFQNSK